MTTNTFTVAERAQIGALTDVAIVQQRIVLTLENDAHARGKRDGLLFAIELLSGIPADVMLEQLEGYSIAELNEWLRGDKEIKLV